MSTAPSAIQELADAAESAASFGLSAEFNLPGGKLIANVSCPVAQAGAKAFLQVSESDGNKYTSVFVGAVKDFDAALRQVAATYPKAVLRPASIELSIRKGPTAARAMPLVVRAWHEAFGLPVPTLEELAAKQKAAKLAAKAAVEANVALLKSGQPGVAKFNKLSQQDRLNADFRQADLAGLDLTGVQFVRARLDGADLSGAKLANAGFAGSWVRGSLKGAKLVGADLTDASLAYCDLRGADFTGATLTGASLHAATFDEHTKWPKKFKPPTGLVWKGTGRDPRMVPSKKEKALPKPADFAGFLERLEKVTDPAKLDKATKMLKAERFRLFAKVEPDHVIGVVRSQSDPDTVYSCRLAADGTYGCCTQNLAYCGGQKGAPCKHLLVLIVGLAKAGELDPAAAHDWTQATRGMKPVIDKEAMTETFLRYKGAEAGEVDWRPTETIPEDFYAL